jgi:hypothetical protein
MNTPGCIELTYNYGSEAEDGLVYNTGNADTTGVSNGEKVKGGFGHIGITVPDVYAACERFKKLGCTFHKTPNAGGMKGLAFIKVCVVTKHTEIQEERERDESRACCCCCFISAFISLLWVSFVLCILIIIDDRRFFLSCRILMVILSKCCHRAQWSLNQWIVMESPPKAVRDIRITQNRNYCIQPNLVVSGMNTASPAPLS